MHRWAVGIDSVEDTKRSVLYSVSAQPYIVRNISHNSLLCYFFYKFVGLKWDFLKLPVPKLMIYTANPNV